MLGIFIFISFFCVFVLTHVNFFRHLGHCIIRRNLPIPFNTSNDRITSIKMNRICIKFQVFPDTIIQFIMRYRKLASIAVMYQPHQECMQTSRPDVKPIMYATMDVKDTKVPLFYAQMERFLIKRNLLAIGGIMLTVHKHQHSISECHLFPKKKNLPVNWLSLLNIIIKIIVCRFS